MSIAAIPAGYKGVQFHSRLEARWAAFFDLCRWKWDYEPLDLKGWTPNFLIETPYCPVFAGIKPVELRDPETHELPFDCDLFKNAKEHWRDVQVLLLGREPYAHPYLCIGVLLDPPKTIDREDLWVDVHNYFCTDDALYFWCEAGNRV
ncbi:MAG TPA: hypothetical protein VGJ20_16640 [Xanthobacteraceae bacterium]|jgi:hypothetical protein